LILVERKEVEIKGSTRMSRFTNSNIKGKEGEKWWKKERKE
jgi:hypothetical protein